MGRCTIAVVRLTSRAALVALWLHGVFAFAATTLSPPQNPGECCPNAKNYGYFEGQWRVWPGESRPERVFPTAVGREAMPATPGQEPLPLPKAEAAPSKSESPAAVLPSEPPPEQVLPEPSRPAGKPAAGGTLPNPSKPPPGAEMTPAKPQKAEKPAEMPLIIPEKPILDNIMPGLGPAPTIPSKPDDPKDSKQPSTSLDGKSDELLPVRPPAKKPASEKKSDQPPPDAAKPASLKAPPASGAGVETDADCPILRTSAALPLDGVNAGGQPMAGRASQAVLAVPVSPAHATPHTAEFCEAASSGEPPLILNGFCAVELSDHQRWTRGDVRWTAVYAGRTFLFCGPEQQLRFLANPARYTPACAGNDPVLAAERSVNAPGKCEFSMLCDGKVYLFSSAETLARFRQSPYRYVAQGR